MTIRTVNGGTGFNAAAQHSKSPHGLLMHVAGVRVVIGSTVYDTKGLAKSAIRSDDPLLLFEHMGLYNRTGEIPENSYTVPLGEASVELEGEDVIVIGTQMMLHDALNVADPLTGDISVELISPQILKPLNIGTLVENAKKTGRVVVAGESLPQNGPASYIAERMESKAFYHLEAPVEIVEVDDTPIPLSPPLAEAVVPGANQIEEAVRSLPCL